MRQAAKGECTVSDHSCTVARASALLWTLLLSHYRLVHQADPSLGAATLGDASTFARLTGQHAHCAAAAGTGSEPAVGQPAAQEQPCSCVYTSVSRA